MLTVVGLSWSGAAAAVAGTTGRPTTGSGTTWHQVDLDGRAGAIARGSYGPGVDGHLVVAGARGDDAMLADVVRGRASYPFRLAEGLGALRGLGSGAEVVTVTTTVERRAPRPVRLWITSEYEGDDVKLPRDRAGRSPSWLEPLWDGEGALRVVGVTRDGERWRVRAWEDTGRWVPVGDAPGLSTPRLPRRTDLLAATTEATLVLAGTVSDRPGDRSPQVWSAASPADGEPSAWEREPLEQPPDGLTDVYAWDLGWWVAGHLDARPVVYDFDRQRGARLAVPDVRLDPARPTVLIADVDLETGVPTLVMQTARGPGLFLHDGVAWRVVPLPDGHVRAVERVDDLLYVLLDGEVWYTELPMVAAR